MAKQLLVSITPRGLLDIVQHAPHASVQLESASDVELKVSLRSQSNARLAVVVLRDDGTYVVQTHVTLE